MLDVDEDLEVLVAKDVQLRELDDEELERRLDVARDIVEELVHVSR